MEQEKLNEVLELHKVWLISGKKTYLKDTNLELANLKKANLKGANLDGEVLRG